MTKLDILWGGRNELRPFLSYENVFYTYSALCTRSPGSMVTKPLISSFKRYFITVRSGSASLHSDSSAQDPLLGMASKTIRASGSMAERSASLLLSPSCRENSSSSGAYSLLAGGFFLKIREAKNPFSFPFSFSADPTRERRRSTGSISTASEAAIAKGFRIPR